MWGQFDSWKHKVYTMCNIHVSTPEHWDTAPGEVLDRVTSAGSVFWKVLTSFKKERLWG